MTDDTVPADTTTEDCGACEGLGVVYGEPFRSILTMPSGEPYEGEEFDCSDCDGFGFVTVEQSGGGEWKENCPDCTDDAVPADTLVDRLEGDEG